MNIFFFTWTQVELVDRFKACEAGGKITERNITYPYTEWQGVGGVETLSSRERTRSNKVVKHQTQTKGNSLHQAQTKKFFTSCLQLSCKKTFPKPWWLLKACVFSKSKCLSILQRARPMPDPKNIQRKCCYVPAFLLHYLCVCHFHFQEKTTWDSVVILVLFVCRC